MGTVKNEAVETLMMWAVLKIIEKRKTKTVTITYREMKKELKKINADLPRAHFTKLLQYHLERIIEYKVLRKKPGRYLLLSVKNFRPCKPEELIPLFMLPEETAKKYAELVCSELRSRF